jgi:hypothetical protein
MTTIRSIHSISLLRKSPITLCSIFIVIKHVYVVTFMQCMNNFNFVGAEVNIFV